MPRARERARARGRVLRQPVRPSVRPSEVEAGRRRRRRRTCHPSYNGDERKIGGEVTTVHVAHIVHGDPAPRAGIPWRANSTQVDFETYANTKNPCRFRLLPIYDRVRRFTLGA